MYHSSLSISCRTRAAPARRAISRGTSRYSEARPGQYIITIQEKSFANEMFYLKDSTKITKTEVRAEQHRGIKREADPEVDEILASARATKAPRLNQVTEVIDLSDD